MVVFDVVVCGGRTPCEFDQHILWKCIIDGGLKNNLGLQACGEFLDIGTFILSLAREILSLHLFHKLVHLLWEADNELERMLYLNFTLLINKGHISNFTLHKLCNVGGCCV